MEPKNIRFSIITQCDETQIYAWPTPNRGATLARLPARSLWPATAILTRITADDIRRDGITSVDVIDLDFVESNGDMTRVPFRAEEGVGAVDFWRDLAPEKLIEACSLLGDEFKFDAVIVDEGQDFHDLWWTSLEDVFRNPSRKACYYVFFDPNQNLYVQSPSIPGELGPPFNLPINCRNTVRIAEHCSLLRSMCLCKTRLSNRLSWCGLGLRHHSLQPAGPSRRYCK